MNDKPIAKAGIKLDRKAETLTITAPTELKPGTHTLALTFSGKINQGGFGLYHAPYVEHGTGAKEGDARHAVRSDGRAAHVPVLGRAGRFARAFS